MIPEIEKLKHVGKVVDGDIVCNDDCPNPSHKRKIESYSEIVKAPGGRSYRHVECPFCKEEVKVFIWSFHGGGKKCECGAKLYAWEAKKII